MTRQGKVYLDMVSGGSDGKPPRQGLGGPSPGSGSHRGRGLRQGACLGGKLPGDDAVKNRKNPKNHRFRWREGFREEDCIARTSFDTEEMWKEIFQIAQSCHPLVAELLVSILEEYADQFQTCLPPNASITPTWAACWSIPSPSKNLLVFGGKI